jgi:hypothetical protein
VGNVIFFFFFFFFFFLFFVSHISHISSHAPLALATVVKKVIVVGVGCVFGSPMCGCVRQCSREHAPQGQWNPSPSAAQESQHEDVFGNFFKKNSHWGLANSKTILHIEHPLFTPHG